MFQSTRPRGARPRRVARVDLDPDVSIHAPTRGATNFVVGWLADQKFQSTRPRGARHFPQDDGRGDGVSIHAPTRGATGRDVRADERREFQSTRPRGARPRRGRRRGCAHRFNPRAHAGRDPCRPDTLSSALLFQSTRPRGARHLALPEPRDGGAVSIHAPTRGATFAVDDEQHVDEFQSTRPRGARPASGRPIMAALLFQSTRPRGARRPQPPKQSHVLVVSIHAPTRGATRCSSPSRKGAVFQSTRPRGARLRAPGSAKRIESFNPRAHAGRDTREIRRDFTVRVSIHAPTRGATTEEASINDDGKFQSTRPRGARRSRRRGCGTRRRFNPRAHAGRDGRSEPLTARWWRFNPRAHAGRDPGQRHAHRGQRVSIHAPTRGATRRAGRGGARNRFNPRAHAGRDHAPVPPLRGRRVSIHAPTRGATRARRRPPPCGRFNPRAHAGRDRRRWPWRGRSSFQSTRPRGARPVRAWL